MLIFALHNYNCNFLLLSSVLEHDIDGVSICPSHAGINSKLITVGLCVFHRRLGKEILFFFRPTFIVMVEGTSNPNKGC